MGIKNYELKEAKEWLVGKERHDGLTLLAQYGHLLYNQRGNEDINIIRNSIGIDEGTRDFLIDRIKQLER